MKCYNGVSVRLWIPLLMLRNTNNNSNEDKKSYVCGGREVGGRVGVRGGGLGGMLE